ncbi:TauD/TfdA family dioxygenase [Pelagibacterales bacterium SAG-MED31]|nr:TauD/TfdA family dioxygenase [Pelagibacterales bacterium SAG-MED31]
MQYKYKIVKIKERNKYLEIYWSDNHISKFHFLWLRDNCPSAFHKDTRMRNFNILTVSKQIKPLNFKITNKNIHISWSENNHHSIYSLRWIRDNCYTEKNLKLYKSDYKLWNSQFANKIKLVVFDYNKISLDEKELKKWLQTIYSFGIAIVKNAPTKNKSAFRILDKIGKYRETFFGTPFEVINIPNPNNQAYTADALPNHTDLPYYEYVPGFQFLHCLKNDADGGLSTAVDGFAVAEYFKNKEFKKFKLLNENEVIFKDNDYTQKNIRIQKSPIIKINKNNDYEEIRINLGAMGTLDLKPDIMNHFYEAYTIFYKQLHSKKFQIKFRLNAGDIFCFDNRRVLHGRTKFDANSGKRHLQGYYIEREEIISKLNYLNDIKV